jgi:hypothetical protein
MLKIEMKENGIIENTRIMTLAPIMSFFYGAGYVCDELGIDVPIWTTSEERILLRRKFSKYKWIMSRIKNFDQSELQC